MTWCFSLSQKALLQPHMYICAFDMHGSYMIKHNTLI